MYESGTMTTQIHCFDCTDWQIFLDGCSDNVDDIADTVTSYIQFYEQMVIQTKTVRMFPNNKPWITKQLKGILNEKKHAFQNGDCTSVRWLNKEFRSKLKLAKLQYKDKIERTLLCGNASDAWKGLNMMMGRSRKEKPLIFAIQQSLQMI